MSRGTRCSGIFAAVAIAVLLVHRAVAAPAASFATPETAVQHFVKRLAAGDLDGAMQAFQIDEVLARVEDFLKAQRKSPPASATSRMLARAARVNVMAEIADQTRRFIYGLLLERVEHSVTVTVESDASIDQFIRAVDPARLGALKIVRIDPPVPAIMNSTAAIDQAKQRAAQLGAEDWTERIALLRLDRKYYRAGFTLLKHGNTWRISQLQSIYGMVEMHDEYPVQETTPEEYEALTK